MKNEGGKNLLYLVGSVALIFGAYKFLYQRKKDIDIEDEKNFRKEQEQEQDDEYRNEVTTDYSFIDKYGKPLTDVNTDTPKLDDSAASCLEAAKYLIDYPALKTFYRDKTKKDKFNKHIDDIQKYFIFWGIPRITTGDYLYVFLEDEMCFVRVSQGKKVYSYQYDNSFIKVDFDKNKHAKTLLNRFNAGIYAKIVSPEEILEYVKNYLISIRKTYNSIEEKYSSANDILHVNQNNDMFFITLLSLNISGVFPTLNYSSAYTYNIIIGKDKNKISGGITSGTVFMPANFPLSYSGYPKETFEALWVIAYNLKLSFAKTGKKCEYDENGNKKEANCYEPEEISFSVSMLKEIMENGFKNSNIISLGCYGINAMLSIMLGFDLTKRYTKKCDNRSNKKFNFVKPKIDFKKINVVKNVVSKK